MITKGNKTIVSRFIGKKQIVAIYKGTRLIWEYLVSCFAKGYWIDDKPWTDNSGWSD